MALPYGWTHVAGVPTEVREEQAVIQQIRDWKKQGWTYLSIAARLNAQSVVAPRGSTSWNYENIDWIMTRAITWRGNQRKRARSLPTIYKDMRGNIVPDPRIARKQQLAED